MHHHCEILLPPGVKDIEKAITEVLAPFDENAEDEDYRVHAFWDWWVVGGRFSGEHIKGRYSAERLGAFYERLKEREVTVSGVQFGKQALQPDSQIPDVDRMWKEAFPDSGLDHCPLFDHSPKKVGSDACKVSELGEFAKASTLIIAKERATGPGQFRAGEMYMTSFWNGVTLQDTQWDGGVLAQIKKHNDGVSQSRNPEWIEKNTVRPDWSAVTVDYHS